MPRKKDAPTPPQDLRDACVEAAREVIAAHGVENLSLRDVARRLGVSHQAPYRHYPSRDHLLAEVMRRCFERFAAFLDARGTHEEPRQDLEALGRQYMSFAQANPLEYRLMFSTPWPQAAEHPDLARDATHTFDILRRVLHRVHGVRAKREAVDLDALYIWSTLHGLAGVMNGNCIGQLALSARVHQKAVEHAMSMVDRGLFSREAMSIQNAPIAR
ncbi:TetR/AcrR family transcriptional regulator [Hydrogenophaga sp. PBL-H3]|uniref:TetR/AcrR family transcriptional regulator n=1 Tax=Hydrogenophaga sp. PBL-H3 TaxID=434010 RepID=UPI00132013EA|nr:TetR/AcrR family transcriptional regulator [Hydrogenophaga sp. PBL-H3]QHE77449.1 TetR/AcrR family transcriptional regulator [Hydrogenophaga sp. PBL-H3]QHE81873.1 TetR/AcrR family transcriptional regulator [Hydrogenophaga sp. PBL-H3]